MEILDRTALEAIGVQWGGAAAGNTKNTTLVGQGFQSAPSNVPGMTLPAVGGVLQPDGSTIVTSPTGVQGVQPRNSNLNLNRLLPVDTFTGLPIGGNLVNIPFQSLPNASEIHARRRHRIRHRGHELQHQPGAAGAGETRARRGPWPGRRS